MIDTARYQSGAYRVECLYIDGGGTSPSLILEGSDTGMDFVEIHSISTARHDTQALNLGYPPGDKDRLYRYLRWAVDGSAAADWVVTFKISIVLK